MLELFFCQNSVFKHFFSCLPEHIIGILSLSVFTHSLFPPYIYILNKIFCLTLYLPTHIFYTFLCLLNVFHSVSQIFFSFHPNHSYLSKYHSPIFHITQTQEIPVLELYPHRVYFGFHLKKQVHGAV